MNRLLILGVAAVLLTVCSTAEARRCGRRRRSCNYSSSCYQEPKPHARRGHCIKRCRPVVRCRPKCRKGVCRKPEVKVEVKVEKKEG